MAFDPVLAMLALVTFLLAYVGATVGLVLGHFRLPLLIWWLGSPVVGASTSLAISTVGALVGALQHALQGRVRPRLLLTVGVPSGITAFFSARYAGVLDPNLLEIAIGLALVISGAVMLARPPTSKPARPDRADARGEVPGEDRGEDR
ncbi:MAG: sulfite exporter TauE/SafE family protein, partial [Myxococcales bacterium]|nr:sulfite exporter TauE/SafE family protein [Myxococcales bacterium]